MPKPTDPIFATKHNAALDALGAIGRGITWGAFDVPMYEAHQGRATRYVVPLWNYHRLGADGRPDPSSKALLRDPQDDTLWYQFRRPDSGASTQWKAQWDSLALCQRDAVPIIGVLKDRASNLCALSLTFDGGPFLGSFNDADLWMQVQPRAGTAPELLVRHTVPAPDVLLAAKLRQESSSLEVSGYFLPDDLVDARARVLREVVQRRGQPAFRRALLEAYGGRCAVTGCDAEDALEAAHIISYNGPVSQDVRNGLLLRADVHTLFDLGLLLICPDTMCVSLAPALRGSSYAELHGQALAVPENRAQQPDREALRQRWNTWA
jgi:5-methylcytosine-specific restriction protein A